MTRADFLRLIYICGLCKGPGVCFDKRTRILHNPCPRCKGSGNGNS